jgi:prevent-host-death family protein
METVIGSYQAKTHLPSLLDRVAKGERITITKNGKPVAQLVPVQQAVAPDIRSVIKQMRAFQKNGPTLGDDLTIRDLVEEGRRY